MHVDKKNIKVLIVEDESIAALHLTQILERRGYQVFPFVDNAQDALNSIAHYEPDIILMDITIKGAIDGIELAERIGRDYTIPVIFITAHIDEKTLVRAKATAPYSYIIKPIRQNEVISTIEITLYRSEMEQRVLQVEQNYRSIFENAAIGIVQCDRDGRFLLVNSFFENLIGYSNEELVTMKFHDITHPEDLSMDLNKFRALKLKEIQSFGLEKRYIHKDGSLIWVFLTVSYIEDNNNYYVGFIEDISEKKMAQLELEASEERFRVISESPVNSIIICDLNGVISFMNQSAQDLFGFIENYYDKNINDLLEFHDPFFQKEVINSNDASVIREVEVKTFTGDKLYIELATSKIILFNTVHWVYFIRDNSQKKKLEDHMIVMEDKERMRIAQDMHDGIGQQITGIRYHLGLLISRLEKNQSDETKKAKEILTLLDDTKQMVRDLSRGYSHAYMENEGFIHAVKSMIQNTNKIMPVNISLDSKSFLLNKAISPHLYFVIKEIISNAIVHGKSENIIIEMRKLNDAVFIRIESDGVHFVLPKVSKGLGLEIIKHRLMKIEGNMTVENNEEGGVIYTISVIDAVD